MQQNNWLVIRGGFILNSYPTREDAEKFKPADDTYRVVQVMYEVRVPTDSGWKAVFKSHDQAYAESEAQDEAIYNNNGYYLYGAKVERVYPAESGSGWQSFQRDLVAAFDDGGERHEEPLAVWDEYHRDLEARGWYTG